jgi:hypothetical protein
MTFNVLTDDFRKQLEQQRKLLVKDRDALVKEAVAQATASIDASLDHISSLLGEIAAPVKAKRGPKPKGTAVAKSIPSGKPRGRRPKHVVEAAAAAEAEAVKPKRGRRPASAALEAAPAAPAARKTKATKAPKAPKAVKEPKASSKVSTKTKAKTKAPKAAIDMPSLKAEFAGLTATQAIAQVLKKVPQKSFDVDQMILEIYGNVDPVAAARTRQRVGVMFGHGSRRNEFEKVQENPPLYKIGRG